MRSKYNRHFITLEQDRPDYAFNQKNANGRCIMEWDDKRGKISIQVQNIKPQVLYKCYLISGNEEDRPIYLGTLPVDSKGKGELKKQLNPRGLEGTAVLADQIQVVAVVAPHSTEVIAPLVGYTGDPVSWKAAFARRENEAPKQQTDRTYARESDFYNHIDDEDSQKNKGSLESGKKEKGGTGGGINNGATETVDQIEKEEKKPGMDKPGSRDTPNEQQEPENNMDHQEAPFQDIHQEFSEMAEKFKEESKELIDEPVNREQGKEEDGLSYIFDHNLALNPFQKQSKDAKWVSISTKELIYLPSGDWEYMNHPFVVSAYSQYNHLLLGRIYTGKTVNYILGVPGTYDRELKLRVRQLGFLQFKCCEDKKPVKGEYGYWLMPINLI